MSLRWPRHNCHAFELPKSAGWVENADHTITQIALAFNSSALRVHVSSLMVQIASESTQHDSYNKL